jgi:hypothetical protein
MNNSKSKNGNVAKKAAKKRKQTAKTFPLIDGETPVKGSLESAKGGAKYPGSFQPNS